MTPCLQLACTEGSKYSVPAAVVTTMAVMVLQQYKQVQQYKQIQQYKQMMMLLSS
jgi:hypothetical protein